jgi:hypothetical protein
MRRAEILRIVNKRLWVGKPATSRMTRKAVVEFLMMRQVGFTWGEPKDCCVVWLDELLTEIKELFISTIMHTIIKSKEY